MIRDIDICHVGLLPWEMAVVQAKAKEWDFPGHSNVRQGIERAATLAGDALTGMLGQYAGQKHFFGAAALEKFLVSRWHADKHKFESDGGSDIDCANVDFKTSLRRSSGKPLLDYNLVVRPREMHAGWVYVLIVLDMLAGDRASAHLLGWARDDMFPPPAIDGIFAGAHVLPSRVLNPLIPIRFDYFKVVAA